MLFVNIDHVPTISLPSISYFNFRAYLQNRYMRYNMSAEDHVKIACKEGASKLWKYLYESYGECYGV
jgi:hypothetical protein